MTGAYAITDQAHNSSAPCAVVGVSTVSNNRQAGQGTGVAGDFDNGVGG